MSSSYQTDRSSCSMQSLLDSTATSRTDTERLVSNESRAKDSRMSVLEIVYFGTELERREKSDDTLEDIDMMAGAKLCKILLQLYDTTTLTNAGVKRRTYVANALASILCVSKEAKKYDHLPNHNQHS